LIDMADDATNKTLARLGEEGTIRAVADTLPEWIERYGVPLVLHVDWKNLYKRAAMVEEQPREEEPVAQFGCMCEKLGSRLLLRMRRKQKAASMARVEPRLHALIFVACRSVPCVPLPVIPHAIYS
jgi:hypothetical protein